MGISDTPKFRIDFYAIERARKAGDDLDDWLKSCIGYGNWCEWIGICGLSYRSFSFKDPKHETLFLLKWGNLVKSVPAKGITFGGY